VYEAFKNSKTFFIFLTLKMSDQTKTVNIKLVSIVPAKDSDGTEINIYTYEVEKNGKISTQTVKTRKTLKYKGNKYDANEHSQQVLDELIKYFNEYKFETSNQLEEFRIMTKNNEKLKIIVDHIYKTLQIKLTQLQLKQLIATQLIDRLSVKINFV